jgi:hypothetical protein
MLKKKPNKQICTLAEQDKAQQSNSLPHVIFKNKAWHIVGVNK